MKPTEGTYWRVPGIKPGMQVSRGLDTQMQNQAGKQRKDLDGNGCHLPREVREGSPVWTNGARHREAREDRGTKTCSFPLAITTDMESSGGPPPECYKTSAKTGFYSRT